MSLFETHTHTIKQLQTRNFVCLFLFLFFNDTVMDFQHLGCGFYEFFSLTDSPERRCWRVFQWHSRSPKMNLLESYLVFLFFFVLFFAFAPFTRRREREKKTKPVWKFVQLN